MRTISEIIPSGSAFYFKAKWDKNDATAKSELEKAREGLETAPYPLQIEDLPDGDGINVIASHQRLSVFRSMLEKKWLQGGTAGV